MHNNTVILKNDKSRKNQMSCCTKTFKYKLMPFIFPIIAGLSSILIDIGGAKKYVESDVYSSSGELLSVFRLEQEMVSLNEAFKAFS